MGNANLFVAKNGIAVGNTTSTKAVINSAGQWIGDPKGVILDSYNQANSAFNEANTAATIAQAAYNFANTISFQGGSSTTYQIINSNTTLDASQFNVLVDTTNGSITINMPTILYVGYTVAFADGGGNKDTYPAYINGNGNSINGVMDTLEFNTTGALFNMIYTGTTWRVAV